MDTILEVFWRKGYSATSLDDISMATGLTRPSLYAAFGNKDAMYLNAIEVFAERMKTAVEPALRHGSDPASALVNFYAAALDNYIPTTGMPRGCLVLSAAIADSIEVPNVRETIARYLSEIDLGLFRYFRSLNSSLSDDDAKMLAHLASGVLLSLATRARAGTKRADLHECATHSARAIARLATNG